MSVVPQSPSPRPERRRRHLIDPAQPPPPPTSPSLTRVQQWVMSALVVTTIGHLAVGMMIATFYISDAHRAAQIGLNVIAMAFGVLAIAAGFVIHHRKPQPVWLALGLIPGVVGIVVALT